jgi:hypothetical protein
MTKRIRWFLVAALPLAACNVQISSPDSYGDGTGRTHLPSPSALRAVALDGAVQLTWSGSVVAAYPTEFRHYRVYSTPYSMGMNRCDEGAWVMEGTTVSDGFLVGNLRNGVPACFAVSTVARDGGEGARGPALVDTPRAGARLTMLDALE